MATYMDLKTMQDDLRQCRRCEEAGHAVYSLPVFSGAASARLMLIGQAPGVAEAGDSIRQPFSGDAGGRLFRWLARAGWDEATFRETCYITSVTKCFPGNNTNGSGDRVPTAAERALCRPWLDAELRLVDPEVIVPVGRVAINQFYPSNTKLADVVGEVRESEDGRLIIPLPHPSGASRWFNDPRNVGRLDQAIHHLRFAKTRLDL
jgi:uracil-DNA glycosylase family 4